jgi:methyltransferase (TIGR00027 family)
MKEDQASSTAFTVLQGILYTAQNPKYTNLVPKDMKDACVKILSASEEGQKRLKQLKSKWIVPMVPLIEYLMMPGITLHYVLRKRYIEEHTVKAIQEGTTQVINLGAGFDTLAYRLSKQYPNVNFIEADHPATHQAKKQALLTPQNELENLHLFPIDFTIQKLEEELAKCSGFKKDRKTTFILEGVLMYLNETQIRQLFESLKQVINANVRVIFTAAEPASKSRNSYGPLLKMYLKVKKEGLNWICEKENLGSFVKSMGYSLDHLANYREFKQSYLAFDETGVLHEGEYIAIANYCSQL